MPLTIVQMVHLIHLEFNLQLVLTASYTLQVNLKWSVGIILDSSNESRFHYTVLSVYFPRRNERYDRRSS